MTTVLTIGRCALSEPPETIDWSGDQLSLTGQLWASSAGELKAQRDQLLGLVDNRDELVFPVTFTEDSTLDGFYVVESASVGSLPTMLTSFVAPYSIALRRVATVAVCESDVLAQVRTNGHGTSSAEGVVGAWPYDAAGSRYNFTTSFTSTTGPVTREGDPADVVVLVKTVSSATTGTVGFSVEPGDWYTGAATFEWKADGTNWSAVTGRDLPAGTAVSGSWRISNGLVRLTPATAGCLVEGYTGSAWESTTIDGATNVGGFPLPFTLGGHGYAGDMAVPVILRNDPDCVVVRCVTLGVYSPAERVVQTFTIRRGMSFVECTFQQATATNFGLRFASSTATSDLATATAGIVMTSNDASGNKWSLMGALSMSNDNASGRTRTASTTSVPVQCAVGFVLDGTTAPTYGTATKLLAQFLIAVDTKTRVVLP